MFALYPFFLDRVKMTERSILFTRRVQMCLWTNEMRLFTSTVCTMQIYRHGRGHTYAHAICDLQNMTTTFILATLCVSFVLIFLRNGCGWFDSHLLLSVDNIPATGYNGSVILGKLQLLRIIRAAILIATFYSYTKRCDAHTQQKKWKIESSRVDGYYWICHQVLMQNFNIIAPYSGGNFQYLHANQSFGTQQNIFSLFHIEFE